MEVKIQVNRRWKSEEKVGILDRHFFSASLDFGLVQTKNNVRDINENRQLRRVFTFYYWVTMYSASCSLICLPIRIDCSVASSIQATNEVPT